MKTKTKQFWKKILPFAIIALAFTLIAVSVGIYIESQKGNKTPLGWCVLEIHTKEDYDCEWTYIYQEVEPKSEIQKEAEKGMKIYCYYITVFTGERIGEWYCFVECFHKNWVDKLIGSDSYAADEIYLVDCDIAREDILY